MSNRMEPVALSELELLVHRLDVTGSISEHPETAFLVMCGTDNDLHGVKYGDLRTLLMFGLQIALESMRDAEMDDDKIPETVASVLRDMLQDQKNGHDQDPG